MGFPWSKTISSGIVIEDDEWDQLVTNTEYLDNHITCQADHSDHHYDSYDTNWNNCGDNGSADSI